MSAQANLNLYQSVRLMRRGIQTTPTAQANTQPLTRAVGVVTTQRVQVRAC